MFKRFPCGEGRACACARPARPRPDRGTPELCLTVRRPRRRRRGVQPLPQAAAEFCCPRARGHVRRPRCLPAEPPGAGGRHRPFTQTHSDSPARPPRGRRHREGGTGQGQHANRYRLLLPVGRGHDPAFPPVAAPARLHGSVPHVRPLAGVVRQHHHTPRNRGCQIGSGWGRLSLRIQFPQPLADVRGPPGKAGLRRFRGFWVWLSSSTAPRIACGGRSPCTTELRRGKNLDAGCDGYGEGGYEGLAASPRCISGCNCLCHPLRYRNASLSRPDDVRLASVRHPDGDRMRDGRGTLDGRRMDE